MRCSDWATSARTRTGCCRARLGIPWHSPANRTATSAKGVPGLTSPCVGDPAWTVIELGGDPFDAGFELHPQAVGHRQVEYVERPGALSPGAASDCLHPRRAQYPVGLRRSRYLRPGPFCVGPPRSTPRAGLGQRPVGERKAAAVPTPQRLVQTGCRGGAGGLGESHGGEQVGLFRSGKQPGHRLPAESVPAPPAGWRTAQPTDMCTARPVGSVCLSPRSVAAPTSTVRVHGSSRKRRGSVLCRDGAATAAATSSSSVGTSSAKTPLRTPPRPCPKRAGPVDDLPPLLLSPAWARRVVRSRPVPDGSYPRTAPNAFRVKGRLARRRGPSAPGAGDRRPERNVVSGTDRTRPSRWRWRSRSRKSCRGRHRGRRSPSAHGPRRTRRPVPCAGWYVPTRRARVWRRCGSTTRSPSLPPSPAVFQGCKRRASGR